MSAFAREEQLPAVGVQCGVEVGAELSELADARRALGDERAHGVHIAETGAGGEGVGQMQVGGIRILECGGDAALRIARRRVRQLTLGEHDDRQAARGSVQGGGEPGNTAAEHEDVVHVREPTARCCVSPVPARVRSGRRTSLGEAAAAIHAHAVAIHDDPDVVDEPRRPDSSREREQQLTVDVIDAEELVGVTELDVLELDELFRRNGTADDGGHGRRVTFAALDRFGGNAQGACEHGRGRALLGREIRVAARPSEPVGLAHERASDHFDRQIEVIRHPAYDRELLRILAAEVRTARARRSRTTS